MTLAESSHIEVTYEDTSMTLYVPNAMCYHWSTMFNKSEPEQLDWIKKMQPGETLFDLGASIGVFTIYAAIKAGVKVCAIDPDVANFHVLQANYALNAKKIKEPFYAFNIAAWDKKSMQTLNILDNEAGFHNKTLDSSPDSIYTSASGFSTFINVMSYPIDELIQDFDLPTPNYLKIDVDGSEREMLSGCKNLLRNKALKSIFIEIPSPEPEESYENEFLKRYGFELTSKYHVMQIQTGYKTAAPNMKNFVYTRKA